MNIYIIGPESSGTSWVADLIARHPSVKKVVHLSYPTNPSGQVIAELKDPARDGRCEVVNAPPGDRHWPDLNEHDPTRTSPIIICSRDDTCAKRSQAARGFMAMEPRSNSAQARDIILKQVMGWKGPVTICSYETLVQWGGSYFSQILGNIGLSLEGYDLASITGEDGNFKWVTNIGTVEEPNEPPKLPTRYDVPREVPKIIAVLSQPRLTFSGQVTMLNETMRAIGCTEAVNSGGFPWEQVLTKGIRSTVERGTDYLLFSDYDAVYTPADGIELLRIMQAHPELSAVYATQMNRHTLKPLVRCDGVDYTGAISETPCGHFGLTLVRAEVFKYLPHPWFLSLPDPVTHLWESDFKIDADIYFWRLLAKCGGRVAQANNVIIGHVEQAVLWPGREGPIWQQYSKCLGGGSKPDDVLCNAGEWMLDPQEPKQLTAPSEPEKVAPPLEPVGSEG